MLGCEQDSDCPDKTRCDGKWCHRTGPGSGNPYCDGTPTPCFVLSESECWTVLGCHAGGTCAGNPASCYSQTSDWSCESVKGCYWQSSSKSCGGIASSCSGTSSYECTAQKGCVWSAKCSGEPLECEGQTSKMCITTPGCSWKYD